MLSFRFNINVFQNGLFSLDVEKEPIDFFLKTKKVGKKKMKNKINEGIIGASLSFPKKVMDPFITGYIGELAVGR